MALLVRSLSSLSVRAESHVGKIVNNRSFVPVSSRMFSTEPVQLQFGMPGINTSRSLLPFDMHSMAGFLPPTRIGPSSIPEAGMGRFVQAQMQKGWVVRADPIMSVFDFVASGGVRPDMTVAIELSSLKDIDALSSFWMQRTSDSEAAKVQEMMSWYMASVPAHRTDTGKGFSYILAHSFITNHGKPSNMETYVDRGMLYHKASVDIEAGKELLLDYTAMDVEPFVQSWCADKGLTDVGTLALHLTSMSDPIVS